MAETGNIKTVSREEEMKQYSGEFIDKMIERVQVHGLNKYGPIQEYMVDHPEYNHLDCLFQRLKAYIMTGQKSYLVDVANYAMFEFKYPQHPIWTDPRGGKVGE